MRLYADAVMMPDKGGIVVCKGRKSVNSKSGIHEYLPSLFYQSSLSSEDDPYGSIAAKLFFVELLGSNSVSPDLAPWERIGPSTWIVLRGGRLSDASR